MSGLRPRLRSGREGGARRDTRPDRRRRGVVRTWSKDVDAWKGHGNRFARPGALRTRRRRRRHSSASIPVSFQGESNGSLLVLGERVDALHGRLGRTRLRRADLFGSPALVASFRRPRDGTLRFRNPTDAGISVRVIATAESRRRLVVSTAAEPTAPGTPSGSRWCSPRRRRAIARSSRFATTPLGGRS